MEDVARAFLLLDREVRPRDVADEKSVAGQDGPGLVAAPRVAERKGCVLGSVPRRVKCPDTHRAELQLPAIVKWLVLVAGGRVAMDVDRRAGCQRQPPVA